MFLTILKIYYKTLNLFICNIFEISDKIKAAKLKKNFVLNFQDF